jgi:Fe-S-cluster containining protein
VALTSKLDERLGSALSHARGLGAPVACKAGCSFCCRHRVTITPHEAIALFRYLRSQIPEEAANAIASQVLANAERIGPMSEIEHRAARIPCAFLVDDRCSAYPARPAICAAYHSLDRDECEGAYNNPSDLSPRIPMLEALQQLHGAMEQGMFKALEELKLNREPIELHTAVAALLRDPSLIARWRSGRSWPKVPSPA